jgi:hypothetical protein
MNALLLVLAKLLDWTSWCCRATGALHDSEYDVGFISNAIECDWSNHDDHEIENPVGTR